MFGRVNRYAQTVRLLRTAGVTLASISVYPIRRRLPRGVAEISLRNGISIVSPPNEPLLHMFEEIWINRCYAPGGLRLAPEATIIDVGANVGVFALWAASSNSRANIICLEPCPISWRFLVRNISRNHLGRVAAVQAACAGQSGTRMLYHRGPDVMNTLYTQDSHGSRFEPVGQTRVLTLDDLFDEFEVSSCGFLKLDCEGAEYEIIMEAGEGTLSRVARISMEYHVGLNQHKPDELAAFLAARGFEVELTPMLDREVGYIYARRI